MAKAALAVVAASLLAAASATAESPLVVMDANQFALGELVDLAGFHINAGSDALLYRYGANEYLIIPLNSINGCPGKAELYYEDSSCSGQAWVRVSELFQENRRHPTGFMDYSGNLYRLERGSVAQSPTITHKMNTAGVCVSNPGPAGGWLPMNLVGPLAVQPPCTYVLNPTIFWDQFQTGDMSRWSNY